MTAARYHNSSDPQAQSRGPIEQTEAPFSMWPRYVALFMLGFVIAFVWAIGGFHG